MKPVAFFVAGTPIPKGSTRSFIPKGWNRAITTAANTKTKPWQQAVGSIAAEVYRGELIQGAVALDLRFLFLRPKSAKKRTYLTVKPDLGKLARTIEDALTGTIYRDDAQITESTLSKEYTSRDPGVHVVVTPLEED